MPILLGKKGLRKILKKKYGTQWINAHVKPTGKFWKRYFNKKVRKGESHKRGNWFEWC